jgi:hypothetical protein
LILASAVVFFPAVEPAVELPVVAEAPLPGGRERILVVDDEPALAMATKKMLELSGYQVEFRSNGIEADELAGRGNGPARAETVEGLAIETLATHRGQIIL